MEQMLHKLFSQQNPTVLFSDIDGTLFSPNLQILTAPIYNVQTAAFLKKNSIPFIIVTGRSFWRKIDQYHLKLLGVPQPDAVITANGTILYIRQKDTYIADFSWHAVMQSTKVTNKKGVIFSWNKLDITNAIMEYLLQKHYVCQIGKGNTYLIRLRFRTYPVKQIEQIKKEILQLFPKGIRIILTEKLLWKNTLNTFSGEMLITPSTAGKDKAIQYVLKTLATQREKPIHAFIFGDATVDIPMLTMKADEKLYTLSQFGVHPTPLARKVLEQQMLQNPHVQILNGDGPKEILWTLRPELRKAKRVIPAKAGSSPLHEGVQPQRHPELDPVSNFWIPHHSIQYLLPRSGVVRDDKLTAAQNNPMRKVIGVFELFLDKLVDKNLSPNEISFLGLEKLSKSLSQLREKQLHHKVKGFGNFVFAQLTDILDGIRARRGNKKEENGQLVDGFADRTKEFMQLFHRAKSRMQYPETITQTHEETLQTLLAAISCCLPSIARAQVEITGQTVAERDAKGGSMIDRTRRLFLSLFLDNVGVPDQSLAIDNKIFTTNLATFQHRLTYSSRERSESRSKGTVLDFARTIYPDKLSDFQKKALERWLLYIDVLQQENAIIKKSFARQSALIKQYEKESGKLAKNYFELPINKLRKKWHVTDYRLKINDYLTK